MEPYMRMESYTNVYPAFGFYTERSDYSLILYILLFSIFPIPFRGGRFFLHRISS